MPAAGTESWLLPLSSPHRHRQEGERLTVCLVPYAVWQRSFTDTAGVWTNATGHILFPFFLKKSIFFLLLVVDFWLKHKTKSQPERFNLRALILFLYLFYSNRKIFTTILYGPTVSCSNAPKSRRALIFSFQSCKRHTQKKLLAPNEHQLNWNVCWVCRLPFKGPAATRHSTSHFCL